MSRCFRRRVGAVTGVLLAALGSAAVGCSGETASPPQGGTRSEPLDSTTRPPFETPTVNSAIEYDGRLLSLNDSGVSGTVTVRVDGSVIHATTALGGLDPSRRYRLALHGFPDRRLSALPPSRETVAAQEVDESVGPALVVLGVLQADGAGGAVREKTSIRVERQAYPLDARAIVISAALPDGAWSPVAVCVLKPAELGDGGRGGPGTPGGGGGAGENGDGQGGGMTPGDGQGGGMTPGDGQGPGDGGGITP